MRRSHGPTSGYQPPPGAAEAFAAGVPLADIVGAGLAAAVVDVGFASVFCSPQPTTPRDANATSTTTKLFMISS